MSGRKMYCLERMAGKRASIACQNSAMNDSFEDNGLTNYEGVNDYNEQVHKKWR